MAIYFCVVLRSLWRGRALLVLKRNHSFFLLLPSRMWTDFLYFQAQLVLALNLYHRVQEWIPISSSSPTFVVKCFEPTPLKFSVLQKSSPTPSSTHLLKYVSCVLMRICSTTKNNWNQIDFYLKCTEREPSAKSM